MGMLKNHVNTVGTDEALKSLGAEGGKGDKGETRYEGEEAGWEDMSSFARDYLARNGITSVYEMGTTSDVRTISSSSPAFGGEGGAGHPEDFQPKDPTLKDKLEESKNLPGLETSEDLGVIMGKPVTHLTPDVLAKMDERYGKGQWIIKTYGDYAYAGNGIFFPQRAAQIPQDAKNTIWASGEHLAKYGFSHWRDKDGQIIGIKHQGGATYRFGSANYDQTINGEVREWADRTAAVAGSEQAAELPFGGQDFMAQPAFPVVGITNEERAQGITFKKGQEARTHIVTRNGKAELIPHTTWLKMESLPVVFEDNETRAMAQAAVDAINALPDSEKQGQIYAPDIVRTADGYKVVEANPANATGSSGYLGDNPFIIDSYVSHLTGREPGHVRFIRNLLSKKKRDVRKGYPHQPRVVGGEGGGRWREAVQHETPHEVLETDAAGGIEPENKQAAREYDLITMPEGIDGTSCANCSHMEESGMCDLLKIHVNERMCCNAWHHRGMLRDYEKRHRPIVQKCADDANRLIDLPDVRQLNKWSCGAASSMAIGRYFGVGPSTIGEWMKELGTTVEHSTHPFAIRDYFLSLGCQVEARDGMTIDDLADYTHRGMPVIVCLQDYGPEVPKKAEFDYGHYLSVIGVGMGLVFAQDSAEENAAHVPGGDVPKSEADDEGNIAAPGRVMIEQGKFLDTWHDKDVAGNPFIRYGIAIGPPS